MSVENEGEVQGSEASQSSDDFQGVEAFCEPPSHTEKPHLRWLDSLRALAALWVVVHHSFLTVGFLPTNALQKLVFLVLLNGHLAVTAFIAISGYSLALSVSRRGWILKGNAWDFLKSRALRIVPPYYCALVLSFGLATTLLSHPTGTHWDVAIPVTWGSVLGHIFLIQDFYGSPKINHAFWSIAVESQIYLAFPVFVAVVRRARPVAGMGLLCSLALLLACLPAATRWSMPQYIIVFGLGALASGDCDINGLVVLGGSIGAAILACYGWHVGDSFALDLGMGIVFSSILYLVPRVPRLTRVLGWKPLANLGLVTYSLYLIHGPIIQGVYQAIDRWSPHGSFRESMSFILVSAPASLVAGVVFYLGLEKPMMRLRRIIVARDSRETQSRRSSHLEC